MPRAISQISIRSGLSYAQASLNSHVKSRVAYGNAIAEGKTKAEAQEIARLAYESEMNWYEGK